MQLDADDLFVNQKGGVFETKLTSDFDASGTGGEDLFRNEQGGTVLAATDPNTKEHSSFVNLERFENTGLITMQDGQVGDQFEISNTVGERDLAFIASPAIRRLPSTRFWAGPARRPTLSSSTAMSAARPA